MPIERHHRQPISLMGLNNDVNIVPLSDTDHKLVHTLCDINWKLYQRMLRKHREATAWHIVMTLKGLKIMHEMQQIYFEGEKRLPEHLQSKGDVVMSDTIDYRNYILKRITGDEIPKQYERFEDWLLIQQEIQLEIQKEIFDILRKRYTL